ncbi:MAG TPA: hypothetical protein DEQ23_00125 [Chlorobium sp.]|uniref:DsrE family protein n=1 Tax=Chlorobium phaeovibrioides (strain DSM 265 / 1930) TaxID=290318 RepID=A4SEL7_CHLPM|nr:hypothetical protein [Chlorobium sp.]
MSVFTRTVAMLALVLASLSPLQASSADAKAPARAVAETKGLFVVVTDADPMTQMMAMVLSTQTLKQGKSVQILLCGPAGELALTKSPQTSFKPLDKSPQMLLAGLIAQGVKVELCPLYLPNTGKTPKDLIKGVSVAKPPVVAAAMNEAGIKLFTF